MSEPHDELVLLMTAGGTPAELGAALEHVRDCAACKAAAPKLSVAVAALEGAALEGAALEGAALEGAATDAVDDTPAPSPSGVARLLARARTGRLSFFVAQVAALFDLSTEAAADLLARAERNEGWEEGPSPGLQVMPVNAGPRVPEAMTALLKMSPGATFPMHPHFGPERVLVLEGGYRDSTGVEVWRGEVQDMAADTEHDFVALDGPDGIGCVCASVNSLMPGEAGLG